MAAARKRRKPRATAAAHSQGGLAAVAITIAFLCLCLAGCGEVVDEDGPPEEVDVVQQVCIGSCIAILLATVLWVVPLVCGCLNRENKFLEKVQVVGWVLSFAGSCVCTSAIVTFLIMLAPRWYLSIKCDQSAASPSCNGHGSMDCNRDDLGVANRPKCTCDPGWTGPTCTIIGTTSTHSTLRTTTTTTSNGNVLLCPGGSDPKLGVDAILDPSTDCPGFSLGMAAIPGAVLGAAVAGAPVLVVLGIRFRQRLMRKVIFDVIVASLDMGSDLFWVLTGDFYGIETLIPAVFFLVSPSILFSVWFFGHMTLIRPRSWAKSLSQVVAASFERAVKVLARMSEMLRKHCRNRFSPYCGCFQYRTDIAGDLDVCCINVAFWLGAVLLAALGLVTIFCSASLFLISGILLCSGLTLTWLIASGLWCATQTLVVMALHVTRLVALRPVHVHVLRMLDPAADAATPAAPPTAAATGPGAATPATPPSDDAAGWIEPKLWHATLLVEAVLESLPCFVVNVVDMVLLIQVGLDSISVQAVLAASSSFLVIFRILFRYFYWLVYKRIPLEDVGIQYQTRRDATGAAAGAVGSAMG